VLAFFGGSFAHITCNQTKDFLAAELSRLFPGREPIILNFAHGGYALPQTFFTFAYFRSLVDISIFIDGLNEPWNYHGNNVSGFPPEYAKASHWAYRLSASELTPASFEATRQLLHKRKRVGQLTSLSLSPPFKYSVVAHLSWNAYRAHAESTAASITRTIAESYALSSDSFHNSPDNELFAFVASQWREYHQLVHNLSAQSGLIDLHFLQPNAFAPDSAKPLTADEVDILSRDGGTGYIVTNAYPLLRQEMTVLTERGVPCVDMSTAFNGVTESIWTDYCHANKRGGMIVAKRIVQEIETRCEQWNPPYSEPASRLQKR